MRLALAFLLSTTVASAQTPAPAQPRRWAAITASSAILVGANLFDAESTVQGMRRGLMEGNPLWFGLLGKSGNRAQVYLVTSVPIALSIVATAEFERRRFWWWWIPNAIGTVVHTAYGISNFRMVRDRPAPLFSVTLRF